MVDEFHQVKELARAFLVQGGIACDDIEQTYLGSLSGGLQNDKQLQEVADVAFRIRGQGTRYVQLFKKAGNWQVLCILAPKQLAAAHPQLIEEYKDEYWRESARLEQRLAADLEAQLITEKKIDAIKSVHPRCFVDLKHNKALCDISYTMWEKEGAGCPGDEAECFDDEGEWFDDEAESPGPARAFVRQDGEWIEIPGRYHSGMRIDPETGDIFTMIPEASSDDEAS